MNQETQSKWAVITGASCGIGLALAKQFAEHGFDLLIAAEDEGIHTAATELRRFGKQVETLRVDLAKYEGVEELYSKIKSLGRPLDAIAINAGVGVGGAGFDKTDLQAELNLIQLNVMSVVHLTKRILPDLLEQGRGRIPFTSSVAAFMPGPYEAVYAASKAFVQSFSEGLREEVRDKGVTITALQPGPTETNFFHRAHMDDTKVGDAKKDDPADVARVGYEALMAGEGSVISGLKNKVQANVAKIMPQNLSAKMHKSMTKPNSPLDQ
jgi:short-subunit dehydrogenase